MTTELLTSLGRYQLKRVIGRGAMGLVYEGLDPRLERQVAVKTILKSHLLDGALAGDYSARFVREAQAAARLNHPNIVTVFDFGEQDDVAYLVMEFIHGRELAAHFEDNDFFDLPQAVRIVCELLAALGYAHERGIVHRDVKPANVMIEPSGRVKLTDFGVARLADAGTDRTQPGTMVGTPSYMSPEQIQGLAVGSRADLFAVGVVLYQFLTRQRPFTGGGLWTIQKKIVQEDPVPPSFANRAVAPVFDAIVQRALAKDPENRYATAAEFAADLRRALAAAPMPMPASAPPAEDPDATLLQPPRQSAAPSTTAKPAQPASGMVAASPVAASPAAELPATMPAVRSEAGAGEGAGVAADEIAGGPAAEKLAESAPAMPPAMPQPRPPLSRPPSQPTSKRPPNIGAWAGAALGVLGLAGVVAWRLLWPAAPAAAPETPIVAPAEMTRSEPAAALPASATATAAAPAVPAAAAVVQPSARATVAPPPPQPAVQQPAAPAAKARTELELAPPVPAPSPARAAATKPQARSAAPSTAPGLQARCSELLQRLQLGETLSPESLETFQKECQR